MQRHIHTWLKMLSVPLLFPPELITPAGSYTQYQAIDQIHISSTIHKIDFLIPQ